MTFSMNIEELRDHSNTVTIFDSQSKPVLMYFGDKFVMCIKPLIENSI